MPWQRSVRLHLGRGPARVERKGQGPTLLSTNGCRHVPRAATAVGLTANHQDSITHPRQQQEAQPSQEPPRRRSHGPPKVEQLLGEATKWYLHTRGRLTWGFPTQ